MPRVSERFRRDNELMDKMHQQGDAVHNFNLDSIRASATGGLRKIMRAADVQDPKVWGGKLKRRFIPMDTEAFGNWGGGASAAGVAVLSRETLARLSDHSGW